VPATTVLVTLSSWILLDECPRWLVSQGRYDEAIKTFEKVARIFKLIKKYKSKVDIKN
jgi:hypothetical protein